MEYLGELLAFLCAKNAGDRAHSIAKTACTLQQNIAETELCCFHSNAKQVVVQHLEAS